MSLKNKNILITRSKEQSYELIKLIENYGGNAIIFPTIEILPPDSWEETDRLIQSISEFDGLIFTSQNAVNKFFKRYLLLNLPFSKFKEQIIFSVGEKTKKEIEKYNLKCESVPDAYNAEDLAELMRKYNLEGKKFLFPRGNLSRDLIIKKLKNFNVEIVSVVVYITTQANPENISEIKKQILNRKIDVITFTSPSTVNNFFKLLSEEHFTTTLKELTRTAVIGQTTANALREKGIEPDIIAHPSTVEGMIEAITKYFKNF